MADSIPSLRAMVNKLSAEIRELKAAKSEAITVGKVITETIKVIVEKPVYQDNPEHIKTIRALQEKLCQFTSQ